MGSSSLRSTLELAVVEGQRRALGVTVSIEMLVSASPLLIV